MLSFSDAVGNLFNRWGRIGAVIKNSKSNQTTQQTSLIDTVSGIVAQLNSEPDVQAIIGDSYIGILNSIGGAGGNTMQSCAAAVVNRMIYRDNPQAGQTLTQGNTLASLQEVIRQMKVAGASILAATITATPTGFTGNGNGVVVTSVKRPLDGLILQNAFAENILLTCTSDSYLGGAQLGNEEITITSPGSAGFFDFNWPQGSNCLTSLGTVNGDADNSQGNILTNSGFEDWTSNIPDNWTLVVGTAGTQIVQETSIVYTGTGAIKFVGDGSTQTEIKQQFNSSTGTSGTLAPLSQFSICLWLRRDGNTGSTGTLEISLVDQNNTVILDAANTANLSTVDLSTLTTVYTGYTIVFRTPEIVPSSYYIRIRQSVPYTSGKVFYAAKLGLGLMTQCYTSGPFLNVHSGASPFLQGDYSTCVITNSRGAAGTLSTFATLISQLFPSEVYGSELIFPYSAVPYVSDNLIS